ncbi:hypothetical protein ACFV98_17700 [Streptomyces violascens]|uniref:hypothetical protein n=1 Tax=Streptomyces violascens TaxID=67381 RepID=UPI003661750E
MPQPLRKSAPQQAPALVVVDLVDAYSLCHPHSLAARAARDRHLNGASHHHGAKAL